MRAIRWGIRYQGTKYPMSSRTVTSPADEEIEIVSDDDWCATAGISTHSLKQWFGMKPLVIRELWERGSVSNKSGQAAKELMESIRQNFNDVPDVSHNSMSGLMNAAGNRAAFSRNTNGKRTFEIALVALPERYYQLLMWDIERDERAASNGHIVESDQSGDELVDQLGDHSVPDDREVFIADDQGEAEQVASSVLPVDRTTDAFDDSLLSPPLEIDMASQVAMSLLTTVVEIINAGSPEAMDNRVAALHADLLEVQTRLGQRLEENQRMRNQLRQAGDDLNAMKVERDGLRTRVRQLEANLQSALRGDALTAVNGIITKRVDEIMRAAPKGSKGPD